MTDARPDEAVPRLQSGARTNVIELAVIVPW